MIYDKLRKLPKVIQIEIYETGDLTLLSDEDTPIEELTELWLRLDEEFNNKYNRSEKTKVFNLAKEIDYQANRWQTIKLCCEGLLFDYNQELVDVLKSHGYKFDADNYNDDIDRILRESEAILIKINQLKNQLPKPSEGNETSIIEVMACYSAILGVGFDFNTCSVEGFHGYEKQVKEKIKAIEAQSNKK